MTDNQFDNVTSNTPEFPGQIVTSTDGEIKVAVNTGGSTDWQNVNTGLKIGQPAQVAGGTLAMGANDLHAIRFTCPSTCMVTSLQIVFASVTGSKKYRLGIYEDDAAEDTSLPTTLLAETNEATTTTVSAGNLRGFVLSLTKAIKLTQGKVYWLAFHCEFGQTVEKIAGVTASGKYRNIAYSSTGLPNPFGTPTGNTAAICMSAW